MQHVCERRYFGCNPWDTFRDLFFFFLHSRIQRSSILCAPDKIWRLRFFFAFFLSILWHALWAAATPPSRLLCVCRRLFVIYRQLYGHMSTSSRATKNCHHKQQSTKKGKTKFCCLNFCLVLLLAFSLFSLAFFRSCFSRRACVKNKQCYPHKWVMLGAWLGSKKRRGVYLMKCHPSQFPKPSPGLAWPKALTCCRCCCCCCCDDSVNFHMRLLAAVAANCTKSCHWVVYLGVCAEGAGSGSGAGQEAFVCGRLPKWGWQLNKLHMRKLRANQVDWMQFLNGLNMILLYEL